MREPALCSYIRKRSVLIVVIKMASRPLTLRKSFYSGTVRQKNIRPSIIVIVENNCTVAGAFDNELFMFVTTVSIEGGQPNLFCNIFEMDDARLDCRSLIIRSSRRLNENTENESKCRP